MNITMEFDEISNVDFGNPKEHHQYISIHCKEREMYVNNFTIFFNSPTELDTFISKLNKHLENVNITRRIKCNHQ